MCVHPLHRSSTVRDYGTGTKGTTVGWWAGEAPVPLSIKPKPNFEFERDLYHVFWCIRIKESCTSTINGLRLCVGMIKMSDSKSISGR